MVPIDKSSTILTILLAFLFFQEPLSWIKWICVAAIAAGTFLMIEKKESDGAPQTKSWLIYALLSALFASLSGILGKIGIDGVESNLGTAIRTAVVLVMAWIVVFAGGKAREIRKTPRKELLFICLSGIATGASWLCYYKALQTGVASTVIGRRQTEHPFHRALFPYRIQRKALHAFSRRADSHRRRDALHVTLIFFPKQKRPPQAEHATRGRGFFRAPVFLPKKGISVQFFDGDWLFSALRPHIGNPVQDDLLRPHLRMQGRQQRGDGGAERGTAAPTD